MDLSHPLATVTPTLDAAVLQALASTTVRQTGARVHRLAGAGSADGVRRVLGRLVRQGIVLAEEHANATLYQLNRDHLAAEAILALTRLRAQIVQNITDSIVDWPVPPVHASLFGSFARGTAGESSDIDILLVIDLEGDDPERTGGLVVAWQGQVHRLVGDVRRWTGNDAQIVEVRRGQLASMVEADDPLVDSWRADHVHLAGKRLPDLLRSERVTAGVALPDPR